jgi:hypothetical protein
LILYGGVIFVANIPKPQLGQTQVLPIVFYESEQLIGGYTIIVGKTQFFTSLGSMFKPFDMASED